MITAAHSHSYDAGLMERLLFRVAKKWVAGYGANEAVAAALDSNSRGMSAILNFLGEDTTDARLVEQTVGEYMQVMSMMHSKKVKGCISVKPTQLGLAMGYDPCIKNFLKLAAKAESLGQFLWIDMESVRFAEDTIAMYLELYGRYKMTGVAVQSYLRRSASDLLHILEHGGRVRLVKGAYHEPEEHAFSTKEQVDENYAKLMRMLFEGGDNFAIATHDDRLVEEAAGLSGSRHFEFQMLMGIRDELKRDLVAGGLPWPNTSPTAASGSHTLCAG